MTLHSNTPSAKAKSAWAAAVQQLDTAEAVMAAGDAAHGEEATHSAQALAALYDAREGLMACPAPDWAAVAFKAKLMGDTHEDEGWETRADRATPWGRLALVLRTCLTIAEVAQDERISPQALAATGLAIALFVEEMALCFVEHREGYREWACNPGHAVSTLAAYVDNLRADARSLAGEGDWGRAFGLVWFDEGKA